MGELFNIWNSFFDKINDISNAIEPFAKRSMLTKEEAIILIIIGNYSLPDYFSNKIIIDKLCQKGLVEYTESELKATSKGAIISKSLITALKKL